MKKVAIAGAIGFLSGALLVLVMARESSGVFVVNRLAVVPHELASTSRQLVQSGDLQGAERTLRTEAAAHVLAAAKPTFIKKWDIGYPLSAWLVDEITAGMASSTDDARLTMNLANVDAQIALILERSGRTNEAEELLNKAAQSVMADPAQLRREARAALGI